jgi:hypothetical protein
MCILNVLSIGARMKFGQHEQAPQTQATGAEKTLFVQNEN